MADAKYAFYFTWAVLTWVIILGCCAIVGALYAENLNGGEPGLTTLLGAACGALVAVSNLIAADRLYDKPKED